METAISKFEENNELIKCNNCSKFVSLREFT